MTDQPAFDCARPGTPHTFCANNPLNAGRPAEDGWWLCGPCRERYYAQVHLAVGAVDAVVLRYSGLACTVGPLPGAGHLRGVPRRDVATRAGVRDPGRPVVTEPCRRHRVMGCDIQRCAEDRRGSQRQARQGMDEGQLEQAAASVRRLKAARAARQDRRTRIDAAYREVAARQPVPSGHSNRHGGSVSVRDSHGR